MARLVYFGFEDRHTFEGTWMTTMITAWCCLLLVVVRMQGDTFLLQQWVFSWLLLWFSFRRGGRLTGPLVAFQSRIRKSCTAMQWKIERQHSQGPEVNVAFFAFVVVVVIILVFGGLSITHPKKQCDLGSEKPTAFRVTLSLFLCFWCNCNSCCFHRCVCCYPFLVRK